MKRTYIKPTLEVYRYDAERGYNVSVGLHRDYVLIQGDDGSTLRASEEVTEYTDESGEFTIGTWD